FPVPTYRRVAFDIEVHSPIDTRVPDPQEAEYKVICASFASNDNVKKALILKRPGLDVEDAEAPSGLLLDFYETEEELLSAIFRELNDYPFVLTFNGDRKSTRLNSSHT